MKKLWKKLIASTLAFAIVFTAIDLISVKAYAQETSQAIREEYNLKASNVSALKTFTYYYDETMPEVESAISFYDVENNKATVRIDEVSCGLAGFSGKVICY